LLLSYKYICLTAGVFLIVTDRRIIVSYTMLSYYNVHCFYCILDPNAAALRHG